MQFLSMVKEVCWGMVVYDLYLGAIREKTKRGDILNVLIFGELLGIPLMTSGTALRLLPHLYPGLYHWKRRVLRERDITDLL